MGCRWDNHGIWMDIPRYIRQQSNVAIENPYMEVYSWEKHRTKWCMLIAMFDYRMVSIIGLILMSDSKSDKSYIYIYT